MTLKKRTQRRFIGALIASAVLQSALADDYQAARAELVAAWRAEDFSAMQLAAQKAVVARPEYPGALFNLALAYALNDKHRDALRILGRLADKGIDFGARDIDEFAALQQLESWQDYVAALDALNVPVGVAEVVATWPEGDFVPEGIAMDNDGRLLLGSIRNGQIVRLGQDSAVLLQDQSNWSVFGMRFHADGGLWFASAAVPQYAGTGDEEGDTGLFRLDVASGEITKAAILPPYEAAQVLGDLVIADSNIIYATDSLTGALYRYYIDSNEFEILVARGKLQSPQGLVLDETGHYLYVADYVGGLYRVATADGSLVRLEIADKLSDFGIDGLYRYGQELIVIQNGIRPHRVAALQLTDDGLGIRGSRLLASNLDAFDEPTLGFVHGDEFYFVANSHWNRFDAQNQLPDGLTGPIVLKLSLRR